MDRRDFDPFAPHDETPAKARESEHRTKAAAESSRSESAKAKKPAAKRKPAAKKAKAKK